MSIKQFLTNTFTETQTKILGSVAIFTIVALWGILGYLYHLYAIGITALLCAICGTVAYQRVISEVTCSMLCASSCGFLVLIAVAALAGNNEDAIAFTLVLGGFGVIGSLMAAVMSIRGFYEYIDKIYTKTEAN
jgi:hypothetical protein